jgi:signal transduction histidine kinase
MRTIGSYCLLMAGHLDTGLRPWLTKRLRPSGWVALDCALAGVLAVMLAVSATSQALWYGQPRWGVVVLSASSALPVAVRRLWPVAALGAVTVLTAAGMALGATHLPPLPMIFVMYTAGLRTSRRTGLCLLGGSLLVIVAGAAAAAAGPKVSGPDLSGPSGNAFSSIVADTFNLVALDVIVITACWATGYAVRQQLAYQAGLREQAEQRARDQVAEARRASNEERLRIAREMHDVVAHTLSLIAVQAGVAGYVAVEQPQEAASALSSIEQTSRGALNEMRALLGLLRTPEQAGELGPAPGLASLGDLIRRTAEAGVTVDLDVRGERPALAPGLDLAAFRVIQEAVTNVVKHAATDRCRVTIDHGPGVLSLEITDHGPGPAGGGPAVGHGGHGIEGMRERVGMYGGEFQAGPGPGYGFRVTARFPLAATAGSAA